MKEKTNNKRNKNGFTLAELLVVVAILAILVAVSIPIFTGRLEASKKTVCDANKQALRHHIAVTMMEEESTSSSALNDLLEEYIESDEAICPKGGTYSISGSWEAGFDIFCSKHDDGEGTINGAKTREKLFEALKEKIQNEKKILDDYFNRSNQLNYVDSGALKSDRVKLFKPVLEDILSVSSEELTTWALARDTTNNGDKDLKLYWTEKDINGDSEYKVGNTVTTLCYDFDANKYYVTEMGLEEGDKGYGTYKKMRCKNTVEPKEGYVNYEDALEAYNNKEK